MDKNHVPVMSREVVEAVKASPCRLFVDCTLGMGGHTLAVLQACPEIRVVGVDLDEESLVRARQNLSDHAHRITLVSGDFTELFSLIHLEPASISSLLIDPGLSMVQLSEAERGFSHRLDGPLDMRKDRRQDLTAADVVNGYGFERLLDVFRRYGEVPSAERIVEGIVHRRIKNPLTSTVELTQLIEMICKWHPRPGLLHPAARVFQALRIEVNQELDRLIVFLNQIPPYMEKGGRVLVLSYHSVEDRMVKQTAKALALEGKVEVVKPFPRMPSAEEVAVNNPSRSARLRELRVL
jgi:16S rRNA (cytosine1402-N4)-methyltransferase